MTEKALDDKDPLTVTLEMRPTGRVYHIVDTVADRHAICGLFILYRKYPPLRQSAIAGTPGARLCQKCARKVRA
jgi:hypothetical protein|tara:strand:+ start:3423 stop:3644 length:222 start_codon:yes stop_codon:yes gene_type:complete